jgi:hypothetical protein
MGVSDTEGVPQVARGGVVRTQPTAAEQGQQLGMTPRDLMGPSVWENMSLVSTSSATSLVEGGRPLTQH